MKLFVDDIRTPPDDSWTLARTVTEAIRMIARFHFDEISLDHDISHEVSIGNEISRPFPCGETYAAVAYFIAEKYWRRRDAHYGLEEWIEKELTPEEKEKAAEFKSQLVEMRPLACPKITLHTSNEVAGDEMAKMFEDVGIPVEKKYMGGSKRVKGGGWKTV